jgi:hypothetical protein
LICATSRVWPGLRRAGPKAEPGAGAGPAAPRTGAALIRSGALRSVKIGGSRRISATALAEFVMALEQDAA